MRNVLVVEASEPIIEGYRRLLRGYSGAWTMAFAADVAAAMTDVGRGTVGVIIADAKTSGLDGFLAELRSTRPQVTRVVLASADVRPERAVQLGLLVPSDHQEAVHSGAALRARRADVLGE